MTGEETSIVTGGAGFIGSHVADCLLARGDRVIVVDDLSGGRRDRVPDGAELVVLDVADGPAMRELASRERPHNWYHLAAQADVRVSVVDPLADARANVLGTISVLEAAREVDRPIVFTSTGGAIYGTSVPLPTPETAVEAPLSPYGTAKLAAEKYVEMHARLYGLGHSVLRFSNVYGPRQDPHGEAGVVAIFAGKIFSGEPAVIFGDGRQTRDYVYVGDVVDAILAAGGRRWDPDDIPVLNVGTGIETSVLELWRTMLDSAGAEIEPAFAPPRMGELERSCLDPALARHRLGVPLDTTLRPGIEATLQWLRAHQS